MKGIFLVAAVTFAAGMLAGKLVFREAIAVQVPCQDPVLAVPDEYLAPIPDESASLLQTPRFQCDGRQHCSQMTSKAEAQFFLANCPDTKMDGDHDGDACEQQF
ncbi:MAG: excalibur calcium-binding domain-containing protein [Rheinheimera sp.]